MAYSDKSASHFAAELSERQLSAREFFSVELLEALQQHFGLEKAVIFIFDTDGEFLSWITKDGVEAAGPDHPYLKVLPFDHMRQVIHQEAVRDDLTYFNQTPRVYRASDYYAKKQYDNSRFVSCIEKRFGAHYSASLPFGINAYIQISFFRSLEEGDYSDADIKKLEDIYYHIATSYAGFKKHEQAKIISHIQDEIICLGEQAYLVTDNFMHVIGYNKEALRLLVQLLGQSVADQIENREVCLWLPFLLDEQETSAGGDRVVIKKIKNCVFRIYSYDQRYSHGIVDRYHWITISQEDSAGQKGIEKIALTPAERKVGDLLCDGFTYQQIADELCISYHTAKNHIQNIFSKCNVHNRYELYHVLKK